MTPRMSDVEYFGFMRNRIAQLDNDIADWARIPPGHLLYPRREAAIAAIHRRIADLAVQLPDDRAPRRFHATGEHAHDRGRGPRGGVADRRPTDADRALGRALVPVPHPSLDVPASGPSPGPVPDE